MSALSLVLDTPELAEHYEKASVDRQFKAGKQLIERVGVRAGDRVLDVGSGTGLLAAHVAELVGPTGFVHGLDPLPLRIEIAKRKAKANLVFSVGDAFALDGREDLPAESFDVIYLNAVFHWFPEKLVPLKSFQRLLKTGGKLALSTGAKNQPNTVRNVQQRVLAREPYAQYTRPEQGQPQRVSPNELVALFDQTGFELQHLTIEPNTTVHSNAESAVAHSQASSFGNLLGHLPEELRERARQEIIAELEKLKTPEGIRHTGARIFAVAVKR